MRHNPCNPIKVLLHLLCLSKAALYSKSRQDKVYARPRPCLKVLLQVLHIHTVAMVWEETRGCLPTHWDEQNMGTSLEGWCFSKRQARVRSVASATSSALFCWVLREACP